MVPAMFVDARPRSASQRPWLARGALVFAALVAGLGCGEDVLVGSWALRLSADAGAFDFPQDGGADVAPNSQSAAAQRAREHERDRKKGATKADAHDRSNDEKANH